MHLLIFKQNTFSSVTKDLQMQLQLAWYNYSFSGETIVFWRNGSPLTETLFLYTDSFLYTYSYSDTSMAICAETLLVKLSFVLHNYIYYTFFDETIVFPNKSIAFLTKLQFSQIHLQHFWRNYIFLLVVFYMIFFSCCNYSFSDETIVRQV